jgi:hypothetical protein
MRDFLFCPEVSSLSRIQAINAKADYRLEVLLDNGSSITLNLKNRLKTIRFSPLADPKFFGKAITDGNFIRWDHQVEISINELFELARK